MCSVYRSAGQADPQTRENIAGKLLFWNKIFKKKKINAHFGIGQSKLLALDMLLLFVNETINGFFQ